MMLLLKYLGDILTRQRVALMVDVSRALEFLQLCSVFVSSFANKIQAIKLCKLNLNAYKLNFISFIRFFINEYCRILRIPVITSIGLIRSWRD